VLVLVLVLVLRARLLSEIQEFCDWRESGSA
jgi:hypothetical protein